MGYPVFYPTEKPGNRHLVSRVYHIHKTITMIKDAHTIEAVALLHPAVRPLFTSFIQDAEQGLGITLRVVQGLRTFAQQDAFYAQGRTTPGQIVTKAKAGQSYHNYGLAADVVPVINLTKLDWGYNFSLLVPYAAKYNISWGGYFPLPDEDHFEHKYGYDWRQLYAKYNAGAFIPGTQYVNI
jgi:peptidoglycan L-alanyl-D-glutamate endopeptidase CwlK